MDAILRQVEPEVKQRTQKNQGRVKLSPEYRRALKAQLLNLRVVLQKFQQHELDPERLKTYDVLLTEAKKVSPERAADFLRRASELILKTVANSRWRLAKLREYTGQLNKQVTSRIFVPEYVKMVRVLQNFEQDLKEASEVYAQHPQDATEANLLRLMGQVPLLHQDVKLQALLQLQAVEKEQRAVEEKKKEETVAQ